MLVVFCGLLVAGRMPAVGYAHDREIALLVGVPLAIGVTLLELLVVLKLADRVGPVRRAREKLLAVPEDHWTLRHAGGPFGLLVLSSLLILPAGGGLWAALAAALVLRLNLWLMVPTLAVVNGLLFGFYQTYAGPIAWYAVGVLVALALASLAIRHWDLRSRLALRLAA